MHREATGWELLTALGLAALAQLSVSAHPATRWTNDPSSHQRSQGNGPIGVARQVEDVVIHDALSAHDLASLCRALKALPLLTAAEPDLPALMVNG
jgi:hypothetical protein